MEAEVQKLSRGSSSSEIYTRILSVINEVLDVSTKIKILDLGCGAGSFTQLLQQKYLKSSIIGADLLDYANRPVTGFQFKNLDLSTEFSLEFKEKFDLITSIEVIEHLNDPWKFMRNLLCLLGSGGQAIVSTPNPESITSLLSYVLRGYHSAFHPTLSPEHKLSISEKDIIKIIKSECDRKLNTQTFFIPNGRIPGTKLKWSSFAPFAKGKRFSENYFVRIYS